MPVISRFASTLILAAAPLFLLTGCTGAMNSSYRHQAREAMDRGDFDKADAILAKAVSEEPGDWKSHYYLGLVRLQQNRFIDAQLELESAHAIRDSNEETPDIIDALAQAHYKQNDLERLNIVLEAATRRYGTTRDYLRQAEFLAKAGDVDGAKTAYLKACKFAGADDPTPHLKAASFYESLGDKATALSLLRHVQTMQPRNRVVGARIAALQAEIGPGITADAGAKLQPK